MRIQFRIKHLSFAMTTLLYSGIFLGGEVAVTSELPLDSIEALGQSIFSDTRLSIPKGQACITCHNPNTGFTDPRGHVTSQGASPFNFGTRNTPTAMYLKFSKPLSLEVNDGEQSYTGGLFWDGRANSLEEQAMAPFLNPREMGATKKHVVLKVCSSRKYGAHFRKIFGQAVCDIRFSRFRKYKIDQAFTAIATAVASFERSNIFSPFSSKFDKVEAHLDSFTASELRGYNLFNDPKTANCVTCHVLEKNNSAAKPLFTDFSYDNLGVPANTEIATTEIDIGLAATSHRDQDKGRFKVPSLRNIAVTAPYAHNGYFKTLKQVVDFYNTRDTKAKCPGPYSVDEAIQRNCWPQAEVPESMNREELGNLKLKDQDVLDLVDFMNTLTDGYWQPVGQ